MWTIVYLVSKLCVALIQFQLIDQLTDAVVGFVRHMTLRGGGVSNALHDVLLVPPLMLQGFHLSSIHSRPPSLMVCGCTDTIADDKGCLNAADHRNVACTLLLAHFD